MIASSSAPPSAAAIRRLLLVVIAGSWLLIHWALAVGISAHHGRLADADCYARLLRVERLLATGAWYDSHIPMFNTTYGADMHWTRPFDVLLLAGTLVLQPFLPTRAALFWAGVAVSPLLHLLACWAVAWALRLVLDERDRLLAVLVFVWQIGLAGYCGAGRADHHALLLLLFVVIVGFLLRVAVDGHNRRAQRGLGLAVAAGIWVGTEHLISLLLVAATLAVLWGQGALRARPTLVPISLWYAVGLMVAIVVERPPAAWGAVENDKVSALHLATGAMFAAAAVIAAWFDRTQARGAARLGFIGVSSLGALAWLGLGPTVPLFDADVARYFGGINEGRSLWPLTPLNRQLLAIALGSLITVLPLLVLWLRRASPSDGHRRHWLMLTGWCLATLPLPIYKVRFLYFPEILLAMLAGKLIGVAFTVVGVRRWRPWLHAAFCLLLPVAVALSPVVTWFAAALGHEPPGSAGDLRPLCADLDDPAIVGSAPATVLAAIDLGPEIVYRTRHRVVATPYHRQLQEIRDVYDVLHGVDLASVAAILATRAVDLVVVRRVATGPTFVDPGAPAPFGERLLRGERLPWMRPVPLGRAASSPVFLFRVDRQAMPR